MLKGIDVAKYQWPIDWNKLKVDFIIIKATEGIGNGNIYLLPQATQAKAHNISLTYYHFGKTNHDAVDNANAFIDAIQGLPSPTLPLALDIEVNDGKLDQADLLTWIKKFFLQLERRFFASYMLYSYYSFLEENLPRNHDLGTIPLWLSEPTNGTVKLPHGWKKWYIRQTKGSFGGNFDGYIEGINGKVDLNEAESLT